MTHVSAIHKLNHVEKFQIYLHKREFDELRAEARRSGRSVSSLVRDAVRKTVLRSRIDGIVNIWDGKPKRTSFEHDTVFDEL